MPCFATPHSHSPLPLPLPTPTPTPTPSQTNGTLIRSLRESSPTNGTLVTSLWESSPTNGTLVTSLRESSPTNGTLVTSLRESSPTVLMGTGDAKRRRVMRSEGHRMPALDAVSDASLPPRPASAPGPWPLAPGHASRPPWPPKGRQQHRTVDSDVGSRQHRWWQCVRR